VALALAIPLVNASALEEFRQAIATVNGEAHAQVRARGEAFDEAAWERLVDPPVPGVAAISPVIETELSLAPDAGTAPASADPVHAADTSRAGPSAPSAASAASAASSASSASSSAPAPAPAPASSSSSSSSSFPTDGRTTKLLIFCTTVFAHLLFYVRNKPPGCNKKRH
jgi:putative ABC transport system permease protein